MSGVVLRLRSKCPQGQLGDIDLASSSLWLIPRGPVGLPDAALFCIGGGAIVQDTLSVTSWSFRTENGESAVVAAFLSGYRLQVVTMQRHLIVNADALKERGSFDEPVLLERGIPMTVRLVPQNQRLIDEFMLDYLNAEGAPLSKIVFVFEMSGEEIRRRA